MDSLQSRCGREARLLRRGLIAALVGSLLLDGALAFCLVLMLYLLRRLDEMEAAAKQLTRERIDVCDASRGSGDFLEISSATCLEISS